MKSMTLARSGFILVFFLVFSLLLPAVEVPSLFAEIKALFLAGKYSTVLEKSLDILHTKGDRLSPTEAAFLHYYIGMAYKKNRNIDLAVEYLKKIESHYPAPEYVKLSCLELADIYKDDYLLKDTYLEKVFERFPRTPEAITAGVELSNEYLRLKYYRKALPVLETIVNLWKKGDEQPELYMLLAAAYSGTNDFSKAIDYLRQAEKLIGNTIANNPFYLLEAGKICYNSLNFDKAIVYLEQLFNIFPAYKDIPEAAVLLAQSYEREKNPFIGALFLVKAIQKNPPKKYLYTLYLHLGRILYSLEQGELAKIKQNYPLLSDSERLLIIVKNDSLNFEERKIAAILLSEDYKKNKNAAKSLDNFYKFLGAYRDPMVEKLFRENLDEYLYEQEKNGNDEEALKTWARLKERKSFLSPENLLHFGEILYRLKLYTNAEEIYRHLVKYRMYANHWPAAYKQLVRIDFHLGRYEECIELLKKLGGDIAAEEYSEFLYYRAFSLENLKKEEDLEELLDLNATDSTPIDNMFRFKILQLKVRQLDTKNEYDKALTLCMKLKDFTGATGEEKAQITAAAADLLYKMKEYTAALDAYRQAFASASDKEWVLFRITALYLDLGDTAKARDSLERLKELNPHSFWVRQLEKDAR